VGFDFRRAFGRPVKVIDDNAFPGGFRLWNGVPTRPARRG